ncbi:MAG: hypothetical protein ACLQGV_09550 [Bryobacteraceae bacterium]
MILGKESPLRNLPAVLQRRQLLFLEATRFTIDTIDLAYLRLAETLPRLAANIEDGDLQGHPSSVSAMLDAWAIMDSLHRLRGIIEALPGLQAKKRNPKVRSFLENTANVPPLRNTIQHLNTEISGVVEDKNWAVFGSLSWVIVEPEVSRLLSCFYLPGTPTGSHSVINPVGRRLWRSPVDSITIERSGISVNVSDAVRSVSRLAAFLEKSLGKAFAEQIPERHRGIRPGGDLLVRMVFGVRPDQIVSEEMPDVELESPAGGEADG